MIWYTRGTLVWQVLGEYMQALCIFSKGNRKGVPPTLRAQWTWELFFFFFFVLKYLKTDFDKKNVSNFFLLKSHILTFLYLGNQRYQPPSRSKKNPYNKICFVLYWEQNKKSFNKGYFFLVARPLPPTPLSGRATKKRTFFAAFLNIQCHHSAILLYTTSTLKI